MSYRQISESPVSGDVAKLLRMAGYKCRSVDGKANAPTIEQALQFMRNDLGMVVGCDFGGRATIPNRVNGYNSVIRFCLTEYLKKQ